jgi:hypothetical protein
MLKQQLKGIWPQFPRLAAAKNKEFLSTLLENNVIPSPRTNISLLYQPIA